MNAYELLTVSSSCAWTRWAGIQDALVGCLLLRRPLHLHHLLRLRSQPLLRPHGLTAFPATVRRGAARPALPGHCGCPSRHNPEDASCVPLRSHGRHSSQGERAENVAFPWAVACVPGREVVCDLCRSRSWLRDRFEGLGEGSDNASHQLEGAEPGQKKASPTSTPSTRRQRK